MEGAFLSPKLLFQTFFQPRAREPAPPPPSGPSPGPAPWGRGTRQPWGWKGRGRGLHRPQGPPPPEGQPPAGRVSSQDLRGMAGGEPLPMTTPCQPGRVSRPAVGGADQRRYVLGTLEGSF